MTTLVKNLICPRALMVSLNLLLAGSATAQTFTTLHGFAAGGYSSANLYGNLYTNNDGANPVAGLILSGNKLYGTTEYGASSGNGTVFAVNTDGTGFTNLYSFMPMVNSFEFIYGDYIFTNSGSTPVAGLILSGNTLYGTASQGGSSDFNSSSGNGTVFAIKTDGTDFTNFYSFTEVLYSTNSDGYYPLAGLILSGNTLYGTAN